MYVSLFITTKQILRRNNEIPEIARQKSANKIYQTLIKYKSSANRPDKLYPLSQVFETLCKFTFIALECGVIRCFMVFEFVNRFRCEKTILEM